MTEQLLRIGFDTTSLRHPSTGVGSYTANILRYLQQNPAIQIIPLSHYNPHSKWFVNKTAWMQVILPWLVRTDHLDLCHFTNNVAPIRMPCSTVITIHDMTLWLYPEFHYRKRLISMRPFIPLAAHRAAAIITVSESSKADIIRILDIPADKIHVIYEAPSADFRPMPRDAALEQLRRSYRLPDRFILFVGTLEPRKNLVRLLAAFEQLYRRRLIPHHLVIVGAKGWKTREIYRTIEQLQLQHVVHLPGYVPQEDLVSIFNLAEVLAFPSLYEGFGLPVVEAMACGKPVITSRCGSLEEVTGGAAEYVEPTEVESIAAGLQHVLTNPDRYEELRTLGLARARHFDWERTAQQTLEVYRRVIDSGRN